MSEVLSQMSTENIGKMKNWQLVIVRQITKFSSSPIFFLCGIIHINNVFMKIGSSSSSSSSTNSMGNSSS